MHTLRKLPLGTVLGGLLLLILGLIGGGCQSAQERKAFSPLPSDPFPAGEHRFLPGEEISIRFPEGTNYTARVEEDGTISLPLVGSVKAQGKTCDELQVEVSQRYVPPFYKRWTFPGEQRVYFVGGQVKQPGRQMYIDATTVTKAIQSAGDFTDFAAKTRVELTRPDGKKFVIDCEKTIKNPAADLPVYPGDRINVPQRTFWDSFR